MATDMIFETEHPKNMTHRMFRRVRPSLRIFFFFLLTSSTFASEPIFVDRKFKGKTIKVRAELFIPPEASKTNKVPAMIVLHGSGGVKDENHRFAKEVNELGVAGILIDAFTARGVTKTFLDQDLITLPAMQGDVMAIMAELAKRPDIDSKRIGLIGYSKGGTVAINSALHRYTDHFPRSNGFSLLIAVYPWCGGYPHTFKAHRTNLHILLGEKDTNSGVETCVDVAKKIDGAKVAVKIYPGAQHAWDIPGKWNIPNGQNYSKCHFIEVRKDTWIEESTKITIAANGKNNEESRLKAVNSCMTHGISGEYNADAHKQSLADIRQIIRTTFKLKKNSDDFGSRQAK